MEERLFRTQKVGGSNPLDSIPGNNSQVIETSMEKFIQWDSKDQVVRLHSSFFWVFDSVGAISSSLYLLGAVGLLSLNLPNALIVFSAFFLSRLLRATFGERDLGGLAEMILRQGR